MTKLYYDNSKDLYEGLIIEIEDGIQSQVGEIYPAFRDKYGLLFAASPDMYKALKVCLATNRCHNDEEARVFDIVRETLLKAEGK